MLDPGQLGTLIIGLGAEPQHDRRRRSPATAPRRKGVGVRVAIARGLRRAAFALDRPAVGEVAR